METCEVSLSFHNSFVSCRVIFFSSGIFYQAAVEFHPLVDRSRHCLEWRAHDLKIFHQQLLASIRSEKNWLHDQLGWEKETPISTH